MEVDHARILHVTQPTDAGVARTVLDLVADQSARGWDVVVASPGGRFAARVGELGGRHVAWEAARAPGAGSSGETLRLRRAIREVGPELVHLHSSKAGLAGRLALRGSLPTVFQPHAWSFEAVDGIARRAALRWERLAARWADAVVCVSEAERARGEELGIRARWRVIPNGVDAARFERDRAKAREDRFGPAGGLLVLCVGRLSRQKGQDVLLDAWPAVERAVPGAALALLGDGPDEAALRARASRSVLVAGGREDVPTWLAAADVFVLPSRWEGLAYTLLEAMAAGRSVVATDVAGTAEALGGEAGAVVPPGDPKALAEAIVQRLRHPALREREGEAGRRRARELFDLRRSTQATADLYAELRQ
ncbi:MAG TPA: glycosyltransferase [Gaiellaceae bacterium]|nr:glycosyltransferase [Gaiellaceae bacterium]